MQPPNNTTHNLIQLDFEERVSLERWVLAQVSRHTRGPDGLSQRLIDRWEPTTPRHDHLRRLLLSISAHIEKMRSQSQEAFTTDLVRKSELKTIVEELLSELESIASSE